jgi:hypothetical protein
LSTELQLGTLVRYAETTSRWFLGVVTEVVEDGVEVEYLSGRRETVEPGDVEPFVPFLARRTKKLWLSRESLAYVMFQAELFRLRPDRVERMQKLLHAHGVQFYPKDWVSACTVYLWPDGSFMKESTADVDQAFEALLPKWLEPQRLPSGSRDPLGFQSFAEKLADGFLPGLTVFTTRIGYYGFIAWAVRELNQAKPLNGVVGREAFHRLERALVLCEFVNHGKDDNDCRLLGQRSKSQVLQLAENNRFRVPERILKNQDSAGALRLYSTSLEKTGFATTAPELVVDDLLPFELTDLGARLAREFEKRVPEGFREFALHGNAKDRDALREWGQRLCFSELGTLKCYRECFLEGFLLGGGAEAQTRYQTVELLFRRKLFRDDHWVGSVPGQQRHEVLSEDDAAVLEESQEIVGLGNAEVLLHFYEEPTCPEVATLQTAAVFELLSLAHTAIFAHVINSLHSTGNVAVKDLLDAILSTKLRGPLWRLPMNDAGGQIQGVRELLDALFLEESPAAQAALGGNLLARVRADACFGNVAAALVGAPVITLLEALPPDQPMADSYERLIGAMVARHEQVSINKSRQRWCYLANGKLVRDDLRQLRFGWHSMRFPQLSALCKDLHLTKEDLVYGA